MAKQIPDWALPDGDYRLDDAIHLIRRQWRDGKQIVLLVGAGISSQSGYPALGPLGIHLLTLYALRDKVLRLPTESPEHPSSSPAAAYSLERDGWVSPLLLPEFFGVDPRESIIDALSLRLSNVTVQRKGRNGENKDKSGESKEGIRNWTLGELNNFAKNTLGLSWFNVLDSLAENRPQLIDSLFDALGTHVLPGAAHNLLSQFVSWFNVRLVLTTNFDTLIERSLQSEVQIPYVFDIHIEAPPPAPSLVRRHLSVVKLHGSHYGLRADRTINAPLDQGHLNTLTEYFDKDALLVVLDYGGGDARVMGLLEALITQEKERRIIRVDALAPISKPKKHAFWKLAEKAESNEKGQMPRVLNIYYPHSRLFLLDAFQKCAGKLPSTRTRYPAIPHTPAPFKQTVTLGRASGPQAAEDPLSNQARDHWEKVDLLLEAMEGRPLSDQEGHPLSDQEGHPLSDKAGLLNRPEHPYRFAVVTGPSGCGVSQVLAQVSEKLFQTHQVLWCDLDEAVSVGTLVAWLYDFVLGRQPDLPHVPLPLDLPPVAPSRQELGVDGLARTAKALWDRLKRDRYLVVVDSVSYGLLELTAPGSTSPRLEREAARLLLFLAMLSWYANKDDTGSQCVFLIGTHIPSDQKTESPNRLADQERMRLSGLQRTCKKALRAAFQSSDPTLHKELSDLVDMIAGDSRPAGGEPNRPALSKVGMRSSSPHQKASIGKWPVTFMALSEETRPKEWKPVARRAFVLLETLPLVETAPDARPYDTYPYEVHSRSFHKKWHSREEIYQTLSDHADAPLPWARDQDTDQGIVTGKNLLTFITEAALCNRPRSWCQLMSLPAVVDLEKAISDKEKAIANKATGKSPSPEGNQKGWDRRSRATQALIDLSIRCGLLRRQQGAFYYMDGSLRDLLRHKQDSLGFDAPEEDGSPRYLHVHQKMLRYYERTYNLSRDITALNYFYWHANQCISSRLSGKPWIVYLEEMTRGLLENTRSSRGHLNAYDHAFLLLRLRDTLSEEKKRHGEAIKRINELQSQVNKVLADLYEDSEDNIGGTEIIREEFKQNGSAPKTDSDWHRFQKLHSRGLNLYRSCAAGVLVLDPNPDNRETLEQIADALVPEKELKERLKLRDADLRDFAEKSVSDMLHRFRKDSETRSEWLGKARSSREQTAVSHQTILRLARSILRLARFSGSPAALKWRIEVEHLLSAGMELLATSARPDEIDTKLLWTRYHCLHAISGLYSMSSENYLLERLNKILYRISLAKSYALQAGGIIGTRYEAVVEIHQGEALIWEARLLMVHQQWKEARARQEAALRELAEARNRLTHSGLALVWWRELTILLCGAYIDTVKCSVCEASYPTEDERARRKPDLQRLFASGTTETLRICAEAGTETAPSPREKIGVAETLRTCAEALEQLSKELRFLLPVIWNDGWRETRVWFQVFRLVFYVRGLLVVAYQCHGKCQSDNERQSYESVCNRLLRTLRLVGGDETGIPPLPIMPEDPIQPEDLLTQEKSLKWKTDLRNGLHGLWGKVYRRVCPDPEPQTDLRESGLYTHSIEKMRTAGKRVFEQFPVAEDWNTLDLEAWLEECGNRTNEYGHGDF